MTPCPLSCKFDCEYEAQELDQRVEDCPYQPKFKPRPYQRWHGETLKGHIRTHEPTGDAISPARPDNVIQ